MKIKNTFGENEAFLPLPEDFLSEIEVQIFRKIPLFFYILGAYYLVLSSAHSTIDLPKTGCLSEGK